MRILFHPAHTYTRRALIHAVFNARREAGRCHWVDSDYVMVDVVLAADNNELRSVIVGVGLCIVCRT